MKQLTIRASDDTAAAIAARATERGESINEYVLGVVAEDLSFPTIEAWLADVDSLPAVRWDGDASELIREDREAR